MASSDRAFKTRTVCQRADSADLRAAPLRPYFSPAPGGGASASVQPLKSHIAEAGTASMRTRDAQATLQALTPQSFAEAVICWRAGRGRGVLGVALNPALRATRSPHAAYRQDNVRMAFHQMDVEGLKAAWLTYARSAAGIPGNCPDDGSRGAWAG